MRYDPPGQEYLSVREVATMYGVSEKAVYKWIKEHKIEYQRRPGGSYRVPAAQFAGVRRPRPVPPAAEELVRRLDAALNGELVSITLFGSQARGDARPDSDVDIVVLANRSDWDFRDRIYEHVLDVEIEFGVDLSVKVFTPEQWDYFRAQGSPFVRAVEAEGVRLWTDR